MSVIYGLIPGMIVLGLVGVLVFFWAVKNGQYEDMEGPAHRILDDDDIELHNKPSHTPSHSSSHKSPQDKSLSDKPQTRD
ncbi:cbb3-type cytochrome oxidase assembly protein CcoS [Mariprofundus ferrooxydans]|nr:cbb3-type cytochrome oxidase assembly protein CcoS [Mariprofundus ferrooxydans]